MKNDLPLWTDTTPLPLAMDNRDGIEELVHAAQRRASLIRHLDAIAKLLEITESLAPPDNLEPGIFENREFVSPEGWRVTIFYDGGELDYIDHFTMPDGQILNFWHWPENTPGRHILMNWRGVGDLARLRPYLNELKSGENAGNSAPN